MRIAIDIDSTLHHYWDRLSDAALRRFGIDLPYEEQLDWGITRLRPDQLRLCIEETHCSEAILAGEPYPDAVAIVSALARRGPLHPHHEPPRPGACSPPPLAGRIGVPYDDLHCSDDKVGRCVELGIELLIDDSPLNLARAIEHGISSRRSHTPGTATLRGGGRHLRAGLARAGGATGPAVAAARQGSP